MQRFFNISGLSLPSCPIWNNPALIAGNEPLTNIIWKSKNITCLGQIVKDGELLSFQELKTNYNLDYSCIFQYLQLKSILRSYCFKNMEESLDSQLKMATNGSRTVSKLYKILCPTFFDCNKCILDQWERDLGLKLTTDQWGAILKRSNYLSKCVRYKMIQFKILHRFYITPYKLNKMNSDVSNLCWHGCMKTGTLIHLLWFCPEVKKFWLNIEEFICKLFNVKFQLSPLICLLGNKAEEVKSNELQYLINLGFLSAKRIILMNWKVRKPNCFHIDGWVKDYMDLIAMEHAASFLQGVQYNYKDIMDLVRTAFSK